MSSLTPQTDFKANHLQQAQCGQNMLNNQGTEQIGDCQANDIGCLCGDEKFILGIRDCAEALCGGQDAQAAIQAGIQICRAAGVEITDAPGASVRALVSPDVAPTLTNIKGY